MRIDIICMDEVGGEGAGGGGGAAPAATGGGSAAPAAGAGGTPAAAPAPAAGPPSGSDLLAPDPSVAPPFKATGKYKAGGVEKDMPPWLVQNLKEAAHEKELQDLYSKAEGLDQVKAHRDNLTKEFGQVQQAYSSLATEVQQASAFVQKGDYKSFFDMLGIPEEAVIKYAVERVKMSPEQRSADEAARAARSQGAQAQTEVQGLQRQLVEQAAQIKGQELRAELAKPEISSIVQAFDAKYGDGEFWKEVVNQGQIALVQSRKDLTPTEAVAKVLRLIGPAFSQPAAAAAPMDPGAAAAAGGGAGKPAVIPTVKGSGGSPAKKAVKSVADLRKRAQELGAQA